MGLFRNRIAAPRTISAFAGVAIPKVASALLQLAVNVLLLRALGPEQFGVVSICVATVLLIDAVVGSAIDMSVLRVCTGADAGTAHRNLSFHKAGLILKLAACVAVAVPPLSVLGGAAARMLFRSAAGAEALWLSGAAVLFLLAVRSVQTYFQSTERFLAYGLTEAAHSVMKFGGLGLLLASGLARPWLVLALYAAAPLLVAALALTGPARGVATARLDLGAARELCSYAKWYVGAAALGSVTSRMDLFMLAAIAGTSQAGVFSAAQVFVIGFQMLAMYAGVVFTPRIMPLWKSGRLEPIYWRFQGVVLALCVALYGLAIPFADVVAGWILPRSYHGSTDVIVALMPAFLVAMLNFPWTVSLLMFAQPRALLVIDLAAAPFLIMAYYLLISSRGAIGAASVTSGYAVIKTAIFQFMAWRTLRGRGSVAPQPVLVQQPAVGI